MDRKFIFQRIVPNDNLWTAPAAGRLGSSADGGYIVDHGFGHEDWNFCLTDLSLNGYMQTYMYYKPKYKNYLFNIVFAIYEKGFGWKIVGFYTDAIYDEIKAKFSDDILKRRATELEVLDNLGELGGKFKGKSISEKVKMLSDEAQWYCWRVKPKNVTPLCIPVAISSDLTQGFGKYFARPTEITKDQWENFKSTSQDYHKNKNQDDYTDGGDLEFPEGEKVQKIHFSIERNRDLVKKAKIEFIKKHGKLYCEACYFNFSEKYGPRGSNFIEAHHDHMPVANMNGTFLSKITHLAMLCSNCHRMVHRRPWLKVRTLRKILEKGMP